jgi:transcription elongation factor Elf1
MEDRDERIIEAIPLPKQPKCPRCNLSPLNFTCSVARTSAGHLVAVIWCGDCGHTLQTQFIGMDQPMIQPPGGPHLVRTM